MLLHHRIVRAASAENATVYFGMQGLDAARHDFREAGVVGDFGKVYASLLQQLVGATGGQQFDTQFVQRARELHNPGFVRHTEQCAADRRRFGIVWSWSVRTHWDWQPALTVRLIVRACRIV